MERLAQVFAVYVALANGRLEGLCALRRRGPLSLLRNLQVQIVEGVEALEESGEFGQLVRSTIEAFRGDFHSANTEGRWKWPVQTFFRRSGCYGQAAKGAPVDVDALFSSYRDAFNRREKRVRYLAPLEFVEFAKPRL